MDWIKNMNLGKKLIVSFLTVAGLALCLGLWSIYNFNALDGQYRYVYTNYGGASSNIGETGMVFNDMRANVRALLVAPTPAEREKYISAIQENDKRGLAALAKLEEKITTEEARREFAQIQQNIAAYSSARDRIIQLCRANQQGAASAAFVQECAPVAAKINKELDDMFLLAERGGNKVLEQSAADARQTMLIMLAVSLLVVALSALFGVAISRSISKPVQRLMEAANKIADGNLDVSVKAEGKDEIGRLAGAFSRMVTNVSNAMHNINAASEQVAAGAKNVSDASISLSQGATQQASSVEQLSSSLEEISSQTKRNADNANRANQLTNAAQTSASEGNAHMQEMLGAMAAINDASANISKIIKVIDEIAFQTNILALNAAVEAARAGQHGKGFAVVAEEVRNLAARSAKAAKETTDMIEGSIEKVNGGTKIANQTAEALGVIVDKVSEVAQLVESIATASSEQDMALGQINQGVLQVSQVVQANSATSEEAAAASEQLSAQAELLRQTVQQFRLSTASHGRKTLSGNFAPQEVQHYEGKMEALPAGRPQHIALSDEEFGKY